MTTTDSPHVRALADAVDGLRRCEAELADLYGQARAKKQEVREWERKRQEAEDVLLGRATPTLFDADVDAADRPLASLTGFPADAADAGRVTLDEFRALVAGEAAADDKPSLANAVYRAVCRLPGLAAGHKLAARVADAVLPAVAGD